MKIELLWGATVTTTGKSSGKGTFCGKVDRALPEGHGVQGLLEHSGVVECLLLFSYSLDISKEVV